jgi:hypothetical protein
VSATSDQRKRTLNIVSTTGFLGAAVAVWGLNAGHGVNAGFYAYGAAGLVALVVAIWATVASIKAK